ncbi:MAG: tetratricopeptide repeat protein [Anaerolineae bacterium]|nr:tetratricopeptide repeat protein [Anaerolineae bacterium]
MKVKIWGARGSIPSPLRPEEVEEKIYRAILGMPHIDTGDPEAVRAYVRELPFLARGTAGGNTPCIEIRAGGHLLAIDAGSGLHVLGQQLLKGDFGRGEGTIHIFISHLHWDHLDGFPMFMPAFVPGNRIFIYGVHDVRAALEMHMQRPHLWPVSLSDMKAELEFISLMPGETFYLDSVRIDTLENTHPGYSYSYRFEDSYSVLVYATDAEYKQLDDVALRPFIEFFRNADVLVFDSQYTLREAWRKVEWGHSSAMIGVDLARAAGVKKLLLFHHDPTYSDAELQEIQATAIAYQAQDPALPTCEVLIAYEGLELDLTPSGLVDFHFTPGGEAAVLTPVNAFDEHSVDQLRQRLTSMAVQEMHIGSIIDLSRIESLSMASLKALVTLSQEQKSNPIVLAVPQESVRQVIKLSGYADYFAIYPSVEAALEAAQTREALKLPGQIIKGRYQIQHKIGEGRIGTVLKAWDIYANRPVALKIFSPSFSEESIARCMQQARLILHLEHPNVIRVFEWDSEKGYFFKAEELVEGPTLHELLTTAEGPLPAEQATEIALGITRALEYAHSWGVIHGDLKPQNVFVTAKGVKVGGFGLGSFEEGRQLLDLPLILLSAPYLAPEQVLGQPLSPLTDLYALGVILYRMYTGRLPFEGTEQQIVQAHLKSTPLPPRQLNPRLSPVLEHAMLKLLAKNPGDRYRDASQVRRILMSLVVDPRDIVRQRRVTLVGREEPLRALLEGWESSRAGNGQLVLISGETGVGKTRLAYQAAIQAAPPVLLIGRCAPLKESRPYELFAQVLKAYLSDLPAGALDELDYQLLGACSILLPDLRALPDLQQPTCLEPQQEQLRFMSSVLRFIKRATQRAPWFVILDDLQWADQSSLELIDYLGHHIATLPLLMIGTYNPEALERDHPLREVLRDLSGSSLCRSLTLERVDRTATGHILANIWTHPGPDELVTRIYQHTGGNPLYVVELARELLDEGLVALQEGEWRFPSLEETRLPQDLREAIWRRIRRLSPDTQALLRQASVLGTSFRLDELREISGLSWWEVLDHLDMALERQLVEEVPGDGLFRFFHTEIQEVLYADLGPSRRRMLHHQAGEVLERRAGPNAELIAEELAYHFDEAGEFDRAVVYSVQAARRAEAACANGAALLWYTRTLEMLDRLSPEQAAQFHALRMAAHQSLSEILTKIGRYDEALEHYASALFEWLGKGSGYVSEAAPTVEMARIYLFGAELYYRQGKYNEAIAWCQKGLDLAAQIETPEGRRVQGNAFSLLGDICMHSYNLPYAAQFFQESLRIYERLSDPAGQASAYNNLGLAHYYQGDWSAALEAYQKSLALRNEIGDVEGVAQINTNISLIHIARGEWEQAQHLLEQSIATQTGTTQGEIHTSNILASLHTHLGNWEEAQTYLSRSEAIFAKTGSEEYLSELERCWSELFLRTDRHDQALDHAIRSVELAVEQNHPLEEGLSCHTLGQVHLARREWEPAEASLYQARHILSRLQCDYELARVRLSLARLALEAGPVNAQIEQGEAVDYLTQALQTFERLGARVELLRALELAHRSKWLIGN